MNTKENWQFVFDRLTEMRVQSDRLAAATDGLLIAPESPLLDCASMLEVSLLEALSLIVNDNWAANFSWWVYDCDYGREPKEAGVKGNLKLIDTYEKLRWLVEVGNEYR